MENHPLAAHAIIDWYTKAKRADWKNFAEIKEVFPATDYVGNDLYVFNIGGNKFRLIVRITFRVRTMYIRFIGTHAKYDKVRLSDL